MINRRTFLKTSSVAVVVTGNRTAGLLPHMVQSTPVRPPTSERVPLPGDPDLKALAAHALDAAKSGGATYTDVRFTVIRRRTFNNLNAPIDTESVAVGVRALAKGAWGFAANTEWTPETIAQLGRKAAEQAQVNAWPRVPPIEFIDRPPVATGSWQTPITRDPLTVPPAEVAELITSAFTKIRQLRGKMGIVLTFERQERTFASSEGAFTTQTIYTSLGGSPHEDVPPSTIVVVAQTPDGKQGTYTVPFVSPCGMGYEAVSDAGIADHLSEWFENAQALASAKPFDTLGQYDVVFDGAAMASIVDGTFGVALEYDRAVGYEANAGGTSYLAPPLTVLGTSHAPTTVTITADRTLPKGAGTVKWDDEGVASQPFTLVNKGVVVDYATSREFVTELAAWYRKHNMPVQSTGCSASESAMTIPRVYTPNLVLQPGPGGATIDTLVSGIDNGFAVLGGDLGMDFQQRTGRGKSAQVYTIKKGKLGVPVTKVAYTFQSVELWKNLVALGGANTTMTRGLAHAKGQPSQSSVHSVQAVAAHFHGVRFEPTGSA